MVVSGQWGGTEGLQQRVCAGERRQVQALLARGAALCACAWRAGRAHLVSECCRLRGGIGPLRVAAAQSCKHKSNSSALGSQIPLPHVLAEGAHSKVKRPECLSSVVKTTSASPVVEPTLQCVWHEYEASIRWKVVVPS